MKAIVHTVGCRVNQYESHLLAERLADEEAPGEVHVVNTCTVTALADRKSRQLIARLRRDHPAALIVAVGCGADGAGPGLKRAGADLLVGNRDKERIMDAIQRFLVGGPPCEGKWGNLDGERITGREARVRALLKVQDGCTVGCTFCRTWQVRGPLRSKTPEVARAEAEALARAGHPEIVVVGINLAQYGEDLPSRPTLTDLLTSLLSVPGVRYRLSSVNPDAVTDELIALFARESRLCPYLHLPLQSGDDAVLERMRRPYTAAEYVARAEAFRRAVPQATLGADVMVGFPGEDEGAFAHTVEVLDSLLPLNVHIFRYSPRPGTAAARFAPRVPPAAAARRAARLASLADGWSRASQERFLGAEVGVAAEEVAGDAIRGRSENYLAVEVRGCAAPRGTIVPARLVARATGHLVGVRADRTQSS
ncbi:MAG TPA: MiaB/RimO family radical SAM methylthiotransferase [Candidatus Bipolaricaulis sp.]|nr:MiaB/RimO family radical SAM methylthiotransferase [Candidatus Bipolaricaulis sp.]HRS14531.1 MiaB/RimO family radical SAM methylthiotransferase [Candidatus Bipolaricaulis sp.]HRU22247.1 MiaB/RimO family radical SAM methylthiotransferase [Candidatus Bipolaricaulis sp.]